MAKFSVGDRVISVKSHEKGVVLEVLQGDIRRQLYKVRYDEGEKNTLETNLIPDTDITDPFESCLRGLYGSYLDFSRINTTFKIHNTSSNTISSLKASKTIFKAYQFKPLLKFLNSTNRRLLIADEVGLGKTIEAGHIMMELSGRKEFRNVLIVCPKMLQEKWRGELKEKFNFNFKIYENKKDLATDLRSGIVKGIINYEGIRSSEINKEEENPLLAALQEHNIKFDLIVCDEAHRMRNHKTQTYKGAKTIINRATSAIFLTATPIMISEENLYNLLHLLDSQQFNNYNIFQTYLSINRPFIAAISQLNNNVGLLKIAEDLKNAYVFSSNGEDKNTDNNSTVDVIYANIPLYKKIIDDLTSKPDTVENRVQIQFDISSMSMMNNIFSRTRKCEVTTDWTQPVRQPHTKKVKLYPDERRLFDEVVDEYGDDSTVYYDEYGDYRVSQGVKLGLIQKKRRVASSVYAYLNETSDLDRGRDKYIHFSDAKFDKLMKIIEEVVIANGKKIIVFALFRNTLKYLNIRLKNRGLNTVVIHGDIDERDKLIQLFKTDPSINVLLSSEVGSEGIDLQFCDTLVNYDLPWNPMVVEQRIGRIDRFGQKSQIVKIYTLIVQNSIQEEIFDKLLDRIGIFKSCIGDLEAIFNTESENVTLQEKIKNLEKELACQELSPADRARKIENIEKAICIEKQHIEQINEGLTDTLTNDIYFRDEIDKIQKNHRYITEKEIYNYVKALIFKCLTECVLEDKGGDIYCLRLPLSNKTYLINFLNSYNKNNDQETELLFRQFINSIRDITEIELTFNQETAYNNHNLIFINAYHPLIIAAKEYFKDNTKSNTIAFQFGLNKERLVDIPELKCGEYFLAIYTISFTKRWYEKETKNELLIPIIFDVQSRTIINNKDVAERLLGESQLYATVNQTPLQLNEDFVNNMRGDLAEAIDNTYSDYVKDQEMRLETSRALHVERTEEFFNNKLTILKQTITDLEVKAVSASSEEERKGINKILPAHRGQLRNSEEDKEEAIRRINNSVIKAKEPILISLSQIKIF